MGRAKYVVELAEEERVRLRSLLRGGKASVRMVTRARVLLKADEGYTDGAIAAALEVATATVGRIRKRLVEEGLEHALREQPRPGQRRKLSGKQEAHVIAVACSTPPEGRGRWTLRLLARIHRWTGMDGVRTAEGGEGVTGALIRARIWVDGRLAGGLQALLGAPMAAYSGCGERDGGIGHGKRRSRTGLARVCWDVGLAGGSVADGRRQAGSGMARSRARARLNCSSQGQRRGRCRVNRRAERVIRPAKAKTRRLRVLVVTIC